MTDARQAPLMSAVFVDFDNIYSCLTNQDPLLARAFAIQPAKWFSWLNERLEQLTGRRRRIGVRLCYFNPKAYGDVRPHIMQCGFEVVDCPALTASGKTSADIRIAIDMLELAGFKQHYDEFILLSADADFTPVMLNLRKQGRGTVVLPVGNSSAIYRAACELVLDQEEFIQSGLRTGENHGQGNGNGNGQATPEPVRGAEPSGLTLPAEEVTELSRWVAGYVHSSPQPVVLAVLAQELLSVRPKLKSDWAGQGSFKEFCRRLPLPGLQLSSVTPGYIFDAARHAAPSASPASGQSPQPAPLPPPMQLPPVLARVAGLTQTPRLEASCYRFLFDTLAEVVNADGFHLADVSRRVRDLCVSAGHAIGRHPIHIVLHNIAESGHRWGEGQERGQHLAAMHLRAVLKQGEAAGMALTDEERQTLADWFYGDNALAA